MKLLFHHNLSPKLVGGIEVLFPGSDHVFLLGLDRTSDLEIREFAGENGFIVVTKDVDYSEMHSLFGAPPKIIWIRRGNCSTLAIEKILRDNFEKIFALIDDSNSGVLTIF